MRTAPPRRLEPGNPAAATVRDLVRDAADRLAAAGVDQPKQDAWLLLGRASGRPRAALMAASRDLLAPDAVIRFAALVQRREAGEPVAYILGEKEFWSLRLAVSPAVLVPRPDSETVVEAALEFLPRVAPARILDLGTGSGCLLLALLSERPHAFGIGVDLSQAALAIARGNARALGLDTRAAFAASDWGAGLSGTFELLVSNPPYVRDGDLAGLSREIAEHEPRLALAGGADGLEAYRTILRQAPALLRSGGWLCLEVGAGQAEQVAGLLDAAGVVAIDVRRDLAGIERCVLAMMKK